MPNIIEPAEELAESAQNYVSKALILARVKLTMMLAVATTGLVSSAWTLVILLMFMLTLTIGVSLYIGDLCGNNYIGFIIVASFYLLLFIVVQVFFYKSIKRSIQDRVVRKLMGKI